VGISSVLEKCLLCGYPYPREPQTCPASLSKILPRIALSPQPGGKAKVSTGPTWFKFAAVLEARA
jgi:hypothetical protein